MIREGLDVEAQGWTDGGDVLSVELFEDGGFACVIQSSEDPTLYRAMSRPRMLTGNAGNATRTHKNRTRISFSLRRFLRMMVKRPRRSQNHRILSADSVRQGR
jgi:hypothetical protein